MDDSAHALSSPPEDDCPLTPDSEEPEDLGFEPQSMVRWFAPTELVRTGVKALLSSLFGAYADKREVQALGTAADVCDYSQEGALWFDYVADLGDGFDATYTVARLLSKETLRLDNVADTQRGRLLVMGGDQVYPAATREMYNNRLVGPYRSALPCVLPAKAAPHLFAIPGNHDWYDGLTSFTRLFCQKRWIGGWKTKQERSYFAVRLSQRWWLWGIDVQLSSDIDQPQLDYFEAVASRKMKQGSLVILCSAEPTWTYAARDSAAYDNLAYFESTVMSPYGHQLMVGLAGDLHTYARYEQQMPDQPLAPKQRFIAGGGGAYLYPTHDLPRRLALPEAGSSQASEHPEGVYTLENREGHGDGACSAFPNVSESRALTTGNLLFGLWNWKLSLAFGTFYLFFSWTFWTAPHTTFLGGARLGGARLGGARTLSLDYGAFFASLGYSPASTLWLLLLWGALIGYADAKGFAKGALGTLHAALHVAALPLLMWGFARLSQAVVDSSMWSIMGFSVEMVVLGGLVGGSIMGGYLLVANQFWGVHSNEVLLGQRLTSYKNFLRFHLDADENLTIYPIGIREVCRDWQFDRKAPKGAPWFTSQTWNRRCHATPKEHQKLCSLIERPIHIVVDEEKPFCAPSTSA